MIRVLFVCLGNICRSPLAESIFNKKLKEKELQEKVEAESAGTGDWHVGEEPDERTREVGSKYGLDFLTVGQQVQPEAFEEFDYLLVMDEDNYRFVQEMAPEAARGEVMLMREFDPEGGTNVPDPYFGGKEGFQQVYDILDRSMDEFIQYLQDKHQL